MSHEHSALIAVVNILCSLVCIQDEQLPPKHQRVFSPVLSKLLRMLLNMFKKRDIFRRT